MNAEIQFIYDQLQSAQFAARFLDTLLKSFVVLGLAAGVCVIWRKASSATRHLVWFLTVASLLFLPTLNSVRPAWEKPVWAISTGASPGNQVSLAVELTPGAPSQSAGNLPVTQSDSTTIVTSNSNPKITAYFDAHWMVFGWLVWVAGVAVVLGRLAAGKFYRRKFLQSARSLQSTEWTRLLRDARKTLRLRRSVNLLQSKNSVMPMTWGLLRPVVLLPAESEHWPEERRRVVLLHELAHVKRGDYLTQFVAQLACALYWFNPLVWLAARQMCVEREGACDDLVLAGGCKASEYAGHLVEVAVGFQRVPQMAAIAMARSSQLEDRVAAIVDTSRNRRLRSVGALAILALIGGIAICLGGNTANSDKGTTGSDPVFRRQIEQLKKFSREKEKQSEQLAGAAGETISPEFKKYFKAAMSGDWQTVTNMYESFKQRHPQYGKPHQRSDISLRTSYWSPVLEISLAYDHVLRCDPAYTQMAIDDIVASIPAGSIYFGGTDPGRGLPTAFCKSHVDANPFYTLTQNALADNTYLEYLERTYGKERPLLDQLAKACRNDEALKGLNSKLSAAIQKIESLEIDDNNSQWNEANQEVNELWHERDDRVTAIQTGKLAYATSTMNKNGPKMIYVPTRADQQRCFEDYVQDAQTRLHNRQLKPGEDVKIEGGRLQVSGQTAVMEINGRIAKIIFDKNPSHEFYIEESFPLDWMYPYLEPHGLIMKINREPLSGISEATVQKDREFWQTRVSQMIGAWLNDRTPISAIVAFNKKVFVQHDLDGFSGDVRFVQNEYASKSFSKWRSSIAGLYAWRAEHDTDANSKERMAAAADLAFRQALALCFYSPEAIDRYVAFLKQQNRSADADTVLAMGDHLRAVSSSTPQASVFQVRLVLDNPNDNTEIMTNTYFGHPEVVFVDKTVLLDQAAIREAYVGKNPQGYQEVEVALNDNGQKLFAEITRQHLHQRLAFIIDGKLLTAPVIASEIGTGYFQITGSFSEDEAKALAGRINEIARR